MAATDANQPATPAVGAVTVLAPLPGRSVALAEVPDPVFADAIVGPGVAIDPHREGEVEVIAPIGGTLVKVHPHAFVVADGNGHAVLVHLGIDTIQLAGDSFTVHVAEGADLVAGQLVITWSPQAVVDGGRSPICPVIALDTRAASLTERVELGDVLDAGDPLFDWA
ncbi:PTS glucose transporter subunit IIA [Occultella aeris]|uniref:Glucose-specific phosphotransferase enzyme IIA component n=1 Tax=Occultella aeris TaxID=2761496 RepID=A0A7M4DMF2_9MICO|nr:PTS glucose transporter subunit IIA [Occultella aeris]VZO38562.1 Glucose-specific phosphotransferase enzyme IIA component [Occultella aeris]